jgi:hypothetical protein
MVSPPVRPFESLRRTAPTKLHLHLSNSNEMSGVRLECAENWAKRSLPWQELTAIIPLDADAAELVGSRATGSLNGSKSRGQRFALVARRNLEPGE